MKIIKREVEDNLEAFKMAGFIEQAGGCVFSITYNGQARFQGALADHSRFIVWGKYEAEGVPDIVDDNFAKWLNSLQAATLRTGQSNHDNSNLHAAQDHLPRRSHARVA